MLQHLENLMRLTSWIAGAAVLCAGCGIVEPHACTTVAVAGIMVTVRDDATGMNVRGPLLVVARDGAFADTARIINPTAAAPDSMDFNPYALAIERPGVYDLTVQATGYPLWSTSDVPVTAGRCHVNTVQIFALLQR